MSTNRVQEMTDKSRVSLRVAIYARVSTADKGQNPEVQLKPLREYCTARGLEVFSEYVDVGQSGKKGPAAPARQTYGR